MRWKGRGGWSLMWKETMWVVFWSGLGRCGLLSGVDGGEVDCLLEWIGTVWIVFWCGWG